VLSELKAIHSELREAIAALEAIVERPAPEDGPLSAARLNLSRLSSRRRVMIENRIYPLLQDIGPADAERVCELRLETARLMVQSSQHIGRWTMRAILADWSGYQRASAEIRRGMIRRIQHESAVLYPLLEARQAAA
jgi:hypothetical protein